MQIVIEIPKKMYEKICHNTLGIEIFEAVKNGTPLPKNHGRIIDESKITSVNFHTEKHINGLYGVNRTIIDYTDAPTIIEAGVSADADYN